MGTDQLQGVMEAMGLRSVRVHLRNTDDGRQILDAAGLLADGAAFVQSSVPFTGDPIEVARLMAVRLSAGKNAPAATDVALPGTLAGAIERGADKIAAAADVTKAVQDGRKAMSNLSKATVLADRAAKFNADFGADIDAEMKAYDALDARKAVALDRHRTYRSRVSDDLAVAEKAVDMLDIPFSGRND